MCAGALFVSVMLPSCKDKDAIKVYRVSKAEPESPAPQSTAPGPASETAPTPANAGMGSLPSMGAPMDAVPSAPQSSQMTSTPPANWETQPLSSMRQLSYVVKGDKGNTADISLVILAGSAGGVLENINRWLSQLGQPATTEEALGKMARHIKSPLGDVTVVDLEGLPPGADAAKDGRIVAGIASLDGRTYFFKMRGNAALAESQKEGFVKWIGTVRTAASSAPAPATASPVSQGAAAAPVATQEVKQQIKWIVPAVWKSTPPSVMRYASFVVSGANGGTSDVSASVFSGDGGGDLANVNRWRSQIGLETIGDAELKSLIVPVSCKDGQILTVDMTGPKARILAGWARIDGKSWFFKLTGPDAMAAEEKARFEKFLQSVQFHP